jgi:hypothetical protein
MLKKNKIFTCLNKILKYCAAVQLWLTMLTMTYFVFQMVWNNYIDSQLTKSKLSGLWIIQSICSENWLVWPMWKGKLHVKFPFEREQIQNEGSFILHLNMYLETWEGFLWRGSSSGIQHHLAHWNWTIVSAIACIILVSCMAYSSTLKIEAYVPLKHRLTFNRLHNVISQKA